MIPVRIQRQRVKGWRMPAGTVYVGRGSHWGNPYRLGLRYMTWPSQPYPVLTLRDAGEHEHGIHVEECASAEQGVAWHADYLRASPFLVAEIRGDLAGRSVACWCRVDQPCHGDTLLRVAAGGEP